MVVTFTNNMSPGIVLSPEFTSRLCLMSHHAHSYSRNLLLSGTHVLASVITYSAHAQLTANFKLWEISAGDFGLRLYVFTARTVSQGKFPDRSLRTHQEAKHYGLVQSAHIHTPARFDWV
ncbi:hypothetical protein CBL_09403 [Carabus blaptoides fortunei]